MHRAIQIRRADKVGAYQIPAERIRAPCKTLGDVAPTGTHGGDRIRHHPRYTPRMRIDILFADRVGIAYEILAVLASRRLNVVAMEVDPPHIYIDLPGLTSEALPEVAEEVGHVPGVASTQPIDLLPGARRRLYLDAVLSALPDPVLAVDARGDVVVGNAAAVQIIGVERHALPGLNIGDLFGDPGFARNLRDSGFRLPVSEVVLNGQAYLADVQPISESPAAHVLGTAGRAADSAGGVITLHAPSRLGERLHALQNFASAGFERILGESPAIATLKARAARVAGVDAPLLIQGETGTGKELVAHACHQASSRLNAPFLALNCAALPENLAESELFGYAPGAFTGAQRGGKPGLLELANQGTVFLDEVGELSLYLQAKLLRFLNDGSFRRVGGDREIRVDVRIISATHRNLEQMVAEGRFREDLFYRLNVLHLHVPALRERAEDIILLARHFIARACAQTGRTPCRLTARAVAHLTANSWPGNVRQLENVIFRAVTMSDGGLLDSADLDLADSAVRPASLRAAAAARSAEEDATPTSLDAVVERAERELLQRLYPRFPSSRKLAQHLRTSHTTIANKLRKYGIPHSG